MAVAAADARLPLHCRPQIAPRSRIRRDCETFSTAKKAVSASDFGNAIKILLQRRAK
jgi:hypothetical protein